MRFVQPGMLAAMAAVAIPIVIHLMFRHRARDVDLGTLRFLKVVLRRDDRLRKLRRLVLLAARMACVVALATLFARPYLVASGASAGGRLVVVLLDRSASMGPRGSARPIDAAIEEARSILGRAGRGSRIEVGLFDREVRPMPRSADLNDAAIGATAATTDYDAAMAWARDLLVRSRETDRELHVLTDLQRSGLGRGEPALVPTGVEVRLRDFGRAFPKNVAVKAVAVAPASPRPGEAATVAATVFNASPMPVKDGAVRLRLESGGRVRQVERTISIDGGASATVEFPVDKLPEGLWRGHVEAVSGDDLAFDDRRYLAISVRPPSRVLVVDGRPGRVARESSTYFLAAALRLAPPGKRDARSPFDPAIVETGRGGAFPSLEKTGAVVLADVADLDTSEAQGLARYVEAGGGLLVFAGDHLGTGACRNLEAAGLGVGKLIGPARADALPWRLDRWESAHPVFRPFADPEHGDLRRPAFDAIERIEPGPDARVIARFRGGVPALLERSKGRGKVLWFASACDRSWGDWPRSRLYLPMVHQMLAYVAGLGEGGPVRREIVAAGGKAGIEESDGIVRVTNPDPLESETARCTPRAFAGRYGFRLPDPAPADGDGTARPVATGDARLRDDELWPWMAPTLIGLLLAESFLGNRTVA